LAGKKARRARWLVRKHAVAAAYDSRRPAFTGGQKLFCVGCISPCFQIFSKMFFRFASDLYINETR